MPDTFWTMDASTIFAPPRLNSRRSHVVVMVATVTIATAHATAMWAVATITIAVCLRCNNSFDKYRQISPKGSVVLWWACSSVCLSVCLSVRDHIFWSTRPKVIKFLCMLPMAVARYFPVGVVTRYVLPVLWMTSYLLICRGYSTSPPSWSAVHTQPWSWL